MLWLLLCFFVKQKTAYEMRISDWSSDVCSSDLAVRRLGQGFAAALLYGAAAQLLSDTMLVLVPAIGGAALLLAARRIAPARIDVGAAAFGALSLAWAAAPHALGPMNAGRALGAGSGRASYRRSVCRAV